MTGRIVILGLVLLTFSTPALGQSAPGPSPWRVVGGAGMGIHASCADCQSDPLGFGASAGIEWRLGDSHRLGFTWTGSWLDGKMGELNRHSLTLDLILRRESAHGLFLRLGVGPSQATVVQVNRVIPDEYSGALIRVQEERGFGGIVGMGFEHLLTRRLVVVPEFRFGLQRAGAETVGSGLFQISVGVDGLGL